MKCKKQIHVTSGCTFLALRAVSRYGWLSPENFIATCHAPATKKHMPSSRWERQLVPYQTLEPAAGYDGSAAMSLSSAKFCIAAADRPRKVPGSDNETLNAPLENVWGCSIAGRCTTYTPRYHIISCHAMSCHNHNHHHNHNHNHNHVHIISMCLF